MSRSRHSCPCPVSILMEVLSGPWTMYLLWVLSTNGPTRFGELKRRIEGISTKVLTERLRMLEQEEILYRHYEPTVPPQVTYGLTDRGQELVVILDQLNDLAQRWYLSPPVEPLAADDSASQIGNSETGMDVVVASL
ncbi:MAG: helix-turn-helix transcriptional regulator [Leptolyngbyaceae cyanobacterium RM2_2_4]|nr:helix-turn-helix transcriptional regulator [Leptolyngbyaceae cyanobacterium SM1_4_3]NJN91945.1 helix-turn-helix transcriptional regulator [Leptolyngbyaceae cyanobacterium SL_5_14]NJO51720.1 helix-turn-helix transcriptional regulator [Leptolyngbyaceae cyanobacterium RM2_2_4]NJO66929.1 helix-turn-helix transcriptional regulator [Leptolyngbyaceae cyanobacterium RM1_405_57]